MRGFVLSSILCFLPSATIRTVYLPNQIMLKDHPKRNLLIGNRRDDVQIFWELSKYLVAKES